MIELLVIGATLTIAAWATGAHAHRRHSAIRGLDRYAQSRGLVFVPPPDTPRGSSPRVEGSKDGVVYVFDLYRLGNEVRTRVTTTVERGRPPLLQLTQRNAFVLRRPAQLAIADEDLNRAYVMTTGSSEDAESLTHALRPLLLLSDRRSGVWLRSDPNRLNVSVSWCGMESDPTILDAARDAAVMVAGWHRPEWPYR